MQLARSVPPTLTYVATAVWEAASLFSICIKVVLLVACSEVAIALYATGSQPCWCPTPGPQSQIESIRHIIAKWLACRSCPDSALGLYDRVVVFFVSDNSSMTPQNDKTLTQMLCCITGASLTYQ